MPAIDIRTPDWLAPAAECYSNRKNKVFVLEGLSADSEFNAYTAMAAGCINSGRQAVMLFPDWVSLKRYEKSLEGRFDKIYALYHAGLGAAERRSVWEGARSGRIKAVIGLRSAIFAPCPEPGLIIVHDEADFSYKSKRSPRVSARDVALKRAFIEECAVVLGGNFPSFETYRKVQTGEFWMLKPPAAPGKPAVRIVDMRGERARIFSRSLKQAASSALEQKGQVVLLMNRRGYWSYSICRDCGEFKKCANCSVSLRYHVGAGRLLCHYCNSSQDLNGVCPECGNNNFKPSGFGIQRVEEMASKIFSRAKIARLDSDSAADFDSGMRVLERFRAKKIDILIDTGMGINSGAFDDAAVCAVISADNFLNMPDFRAAENLFRFAARASSSLKKGTSFIIQTYNPGHYVMDCLKTLDSRGFYARESVIRKKLSYPPFGGICNIIVSAETKKKSEDSADKLAGVLRGSLPGEVEVLGPVPAVVSKIRNQHRSQIVLKSPCWDDSAGKLKDILNLTRKRRLIKPGVGITVDVDPLNMF